MDKPLCNYLDEMGIEYRIEAGLTLIPLPNQFGDLCYKSSDGDDVLGLIGEDWHTHSDVEGGVAGLAQVISDIFNGDLLLIRELEAGKKQRRKIEENLEQYLEYLPKGASYEVCNRS